MPCPHNEITIVQRSQRQSAVAAAAYQSGEKLFCEYDQQVKHYPEKRGIVHNEILLPANAPRSYADRNTLWNAAEAVEKQWNSQLARRWVLTIPREIPPDQYAVLVREFCQKQFVSKGMIADFAIHDPHPPGHNPHAHVMLTMRAMDEHGKWLPKSRKVYDLDENGERIKLPSGRWKSHKEDTVDWNDQKYCEIWRHEWEVIQNRYLEANDRPERVDLRSYARQGLDIVPTVHEGAAVRQMEKRGIQTNIGNLNREIRAANRLMKSIRQLIQNLKGWITELGEKRKELLAQKAAEEATLLPNLLMKYMEIRKEERKDWTRAGQNRGTSQDLKAVSEALSYLRQKGLSTVEDLEAFLESSGKSAADYRNQMKPKEARSKVIDGILASRTDCKECKPVYEKYQKIFFKKTKEKFKQEHPEVARYAKAAAYLAKHPDDKDSTQKELQEEQEKLLEEIAELMNCGTQKAVKLVKELDSSNGIGLIEKKRLGLGKPNVIYVKNFMIREVPDQKPTGSCADLQAEHEEHKKIADLQSKQKRHEECADLQQEAENKGKTGISLNCENHHSGVVKTTIQDYGESQFQNSENHNSRMVENTNPEFPESQFQNSENHHSGIVEITNPEYPKSQSNNTDINKTDISETEINQSYPIISGNAQKKKDVMEKMRAYREVIHENIDYQYHAKEDVDELVELMIEVMMMPEDSMIRIAGVEKPVALVKNRFMKLNYSHIEYVLFCLNRNTTKIGNIKAYLLTALYNAPATINSYYQAEVNHDMYGG